MDYQLGLIGFPIEHSLSPWIHESFMEQVNVKGSYRRIEIQPDTNFQEQFSMLKEKKLDGFNITVPYKQEILPFLDKIDPVATDIGAVNTVSVENGCWVGYNTDGIGYLRSLEKAYPKIMKQEKARILLLGAGGACRGIYHAFLNAGFSHIDIANRTIEKAENITTLKNEETVTKVMTLEEAESLIDRYDLIIQTSSVGMKPETDRSIIQLKKIKKGAIVSDIVYQPIQTAFLHQARNLGALIHNGHTMLLYQAQYAFEIWTGKRVPIGDMESKLKLILEG
ncbi:shikimate dehydrogenase [Oceanobacillus manasiensis]|uniref:shikimate dehydrogenase n=1 Tax=Oceanobacillus manasiensis TaxID=586413 RepID=UPI0005A91452|nr:shikimate dehydrogenase [Oceanobacillus manasiensis]